MPSEYVMDALDPKLNEAFDGKVVRKDLLHRIKKGTNVPTFVLEFLLARYCASNDPAEIQAGMEAVLSTLQENYVRPDEANAAQSRVAMKGKHKFIDKVHVRYVEKEKRHWASLENFASQRIAIGEKFYRDNDRLLEGGIWAEVVIAHNDVDADDYAFYVEDLRPIQLSRFDFAAYGEAKKAFSRDEWMDVVLRSVGLEPSKLSQRVKLHFIARLAPLVEAELQLHRAWPARHRQVLLLQRVLALLDAHQRRSGDQVGAVLQQRAPQDRPGRVLGHGRVRRGRRHQGQRSRHDPNHEGLHGQRSLLARAWRSSPTPAWPSSAISTCRSSRSSTRRNTTCSSRCRSSSILRSWTVSPAIFRAGRCRRTAAHS